MELSLKDKVYGAIFGGAIGDALGLGAEFMTPGEVSFRYPRGLNSYSDIIRDGHRSQWEPGECSADTEYVIMLVEDIADCGKFDYMSYAGRLKRWEAEGPRDVVPHVQWVLDDPAYLDDPLKCAEQVWLRRGFLDASNEALGRSVIIGIYKEDHAGDVDTCCRVTHPDTRCVASCAVIARVASDIFRRGCMTSLDDLRQLASSIDPRVTPYIDYATESRISALELHDDDTYWFTRKTMACSLWTLMHCDSATEALRCVTGAGGDADTNAACALSLVGLRDGFDSLPSHLVEGLKMYERLKNGAEAFTAFMQR